MATGEADPASTLMQEAFAARSLVRACSAATLATQRDGQPFASLVTPASAPDLSPLLWLSTLSEHTRQLVAEPRCALLYQGRPVEANPQTAPRVTLTGLAEKVPAAEAEGLKARWLARHPYAALYADFADFALWRVRIGGGLLVGGFAQARRLRPDELLPKPSAVAAIAATEADIVAHVNADHADAVAAIAQGLLGGGGAAWRLAAVEVDGALLLAGEAALWLPFDAPVASAEAIRTQLVRAAREGRRRLAQTGPAAQA
jgi:hypothetical protein